MLAFKIMELNKKNNFQKQLSDNEIKVAVDRHNPENIYRYLYAVYKSIASGEYVKGDKDELFTEN